MPRIPGFPERPHYNSVKAYLSELAKDIAEMVVDPVKMERFREQLKIYAGFWKQWSTFDEADSQGYWVPSMGRPECIFNIFSRSYNPLKDIEKEAKRLAGSYALCALIHDSQLPHLDKINTDIIPIEAVEETLSAPRNTLEDRIVGNWNSGPDVREIYLIEEFFNRVKVDLRELCKSEENKLTQASIEGQIQQASQLSDEEFLELTAKKFEERAKKLLSKDETWHDLDRALKVWFDVAIEHLEKHGFKNKTDLLKYLYKNLLHYARGINIRNFRGFPDSRIVELASNQASKLAEKFKEFAHRAKVSLKNAKAEIPVISKENEFDTIVELLQKDYLLENEDNLKQKTAEIVQDFISRGLANSTACVSKQLQAHFEHINELIDHVIKSLKQDFAGIPLANFKEKLLTIVNEEYKKLIPFAKLRLVNAGLASPSILKSVEQQINKEEERAKQIIETRCAILEKQKAVPKDKGDLAETEQVSLHEIIEVLRNWQKSKKTGKDFEAAKSALPPIAKTYDILCRSKGQYGAKTTDIIRWLGSAANDGSGYYPALLENFASPEIIADLEKWQEKPTEMVQGNKDTKREREGMIVVRKPWYKKAWAITIAIIIILGGIWTTIQIYESETFKSIFSSSKEKIQIPSGKKIVNTSGNYYLKAEKLLNDDKDKNGDEVHVQLFIGEGNVNNIHLTFANEGVVKKLELDKFKEKFVTMRLSIKDKKRKKNEIPIGGIEHIDFKENAAEPILFKGSHGGVGKVRYSLIYRISQK